MAPKLKRCRFGWDAEAIAQAAGVEVRFPCGFGGSGSAYLLKDGRVMKLTSSAWEAALGVHLAAHGTDGMPLPRVDAVLFHPKVGEEWDDCWVVIREDVDDLWEDPTEAEEAKAAAWDAVYSGWNACLDPARSEAILASWDQHGPELRQLAEGFRQMRDTSAIRVGDWWVENCGRTRDGRVVVRDMSDAVLPESIRILADPDTLPQAITTAGPAPKGR